MNANVNSDLLEEVFNEIESIDDSKEPEKCTQRSFLEDLLNLEKETLSRKKKHNNKKNTPADICNKLDEDNGVIHEGLTDSSDDEDNKYFEECNYNSCGKTLKNLIKKKREESTSNILPLKVSETKDTCTKNKLIEKLRAELNKKNISNSSNNICIRDPILSMNIINPLISSTALREKLLGRITISTEKIKIFLETPASTNCDWVTGGAVVSKITRTSQKGNQYCVWHLTDLSGDMKTVSLFLFGSAYKEYWKTSLGTVVGILNPMVMDREDKPNVTLRVDNAQKILMIGTSKDYGLCKSKKKNGENCMSVVNKSKCDYCVYHMKKEYNKACKRSDLQPPKIGRNLDKLRAKVLGKNQVFYGGKTFTGVISRQSSKYSEKDKIRMKLLSESGVSKSCALQEKDNAILKRLSDSTVVQNKSSPAPQVDSQMIDLNFTITKKERNAAKANALKYIRENGPLKKIIENEKTKRTLEQVSRLKRKLETEETERENKKLKQKEESPKNPLKEKYLKNGITEEFINLMNSKSRDENLIKVAETEEQVKYFNKLEMKEKIEEKMASTFKVECKAVRCLKCNYKAFCASELCKREKHPLKVVNAIKRFWKCKNCSGKTVCLELVPLHSCKNCGSSKWEKSSMMPEKKDFNLIRAPLSVRGDEEAFLGTAARQANLNLLVPEETS